MQNNSFYPDEDMQHMINIYQGIFSATLQPELCYLIHTLSNTLPIVKQSLSNMVSFQKGAKKEGREKYPFEHCEDTINRAIQEKCIQMKEKNSIMRQKLLNMKKKLVSLMNSSETAGKFKNKYSESLKEIILMNSEMTEKLEKIRHVKPLEIKFKEQNQYIEKELLMFLKYSSEALQKEYISFKQEMNIIEKYCNLKD